MVTLVVRWDVVRELQIIPPGCNEKHRADRRMKEAGEMDKNGKVRVSSRVEEFRLHPVENSEPYRGFKRRSDVTRFVVLKDKNKQYNLGIKKARSGKGLALINVSNVYEHFLS